MALWTSTGDGKITPEVLETFMESIGSVSKLSNSRAVHDKFPPYTCCIKHLYGGNLKGTILTW